MNKAEFSEFPTKPVPPEQPTLSERYTQNNQFFQDNLEVFPSTFETVDPVYFVHKLENSLLKQFRRPGIPTITYFVGPPRSGKTTAEFQKNKIMLDRATGRIQSIAKVTRSRLINHRLEWGEGVFKQSEENRVYGDYHASEELHIAKQGEADRAADDIGTTLARTIWGINAYGREFAADAGNVSRSPDIHFIDIDGPGMVGIRVEDPSTEDAPSTDEIVLIDQGLADADVTDQSPTKTVGLVRDSDLLRRLVQKEGEFQNLEYDLYVVGMVATSDVEDYAYETRRLLEQVDTNEAFAEFSESEKMEERRRILEQRNVDLNLTGPEARHYIENMAKTYQMDAISTDVNQVVSYLASERRIRSTTYRGDITPEELNNQPSLRDELLPQAMRTFLQDYIGVEDDKGVIFINKAVSAVVVEEAVLTDEVRRPMKEADKTDD